MFKTIITIIFLSFIVICLAQFCFIIHGTIA